MAKSNDIDRKALLAACVTDGKLNETGQETLAALLHYLPAYHKGRWGKAFLAMMGKLVPACVELVIRGPRGAYLTPRHDEFFDGDHTPGTYIGPGETIPEAVGRCAKQEKLGVSLRVVNDTLKGFSHHDSPRFHDFSNLVLCEVESGELQGGEWFSECPDSMIPEHRKFWPAIAKNL